MLLCFGLTRLVRMGWFISVQKGHMRRTFNLYCVSKSHN